MDDYSDSSFQIPVAASSSSNFLLADEGSDFLTGTDITFATPATLRRTRTRSDDRLTLAELTPKPRTSRMPVRRSPRKHKATPAIPSPLKPVVESDPSAAMEDTLSPPRPPLDRSFQIPVLRDADADLLMADDSGEMFRAGGDASFGDTLPVPAHAPEEALTLSQLTAPTQRAASPPPAAIRSLPPLAEEDTPETSTPAVPGSSAAPEDIEKSPLRVPAAALPNLVAAVETAGDDGEQPRLPEAAPSVPFASPTEARARTLSVPDASSDKMDGGVDPGEASPTDEAADAPIPAPVPVPHRRRNSQAKTQSVRPDSLRLSN